MPREFSPHHKSQRQRCKYGAVSGRHVCGLLLAIGEVTELYIKSIPEDTDTGLTCYINVHLLG